MCFHIVDRAIVYNCSYKHITCKQKSYNMGLIEMLSFVVNACLHIFVC